MNNYYTIKILLKEVHSRIEYSYFEQAFSFQKNSINLCFYKDNEEFKIVINSEKNNTACYLQESGKEPKTNAAHFFNSLKQLQVKAIRQIEGERALEFIFSENISLICTLFGSSANAFLLEQGKVVESFKHSKKWVSKLESNLFPVFSNTSKNIKSAKAIVLDEAPKLPRHWIDELIHYSNVLESDEIMLRQKAKEWVQVLETKPNPRLLSDHRFTLFPFSVLPLETKYEFETVNEAIRRCWSIVQNENNLKTEKDLWITRFSQKIRYLEGIINQGEQKEKQEKQFELWQEFGHLLMSQPEPQRKLTLIEVQNYFNQNEKISIPLKHDISLLENAERYYKRATNAKKSIQIVEKQAKHASIQLEELKPVFIELLNCLRYQAFTDWKKKYSKVLDSLKDQKGNAQESEGFAIFRIDGYDIWMGKNAKSNDLVLQNAHKEDLWFHARGVGGSHVLIRMNKQKENPPKQVMEKIASLAAWHSQAKGSSMVPVQVARRKFLRKPKGADAGLVIVDKEEVLLVSPKRDIE